MSRNGHPTFGLPRDAGAVVVGRFEMHIGQRFDAHRHPVHQLAWSEQGILAVTISERTWVLPSTRALWIPAGLVHTTEASSPGTMTSSFFRVAGCPVKWKTPTVVAMTPLTRELVRCLASERLKPTALKHAQRLLFETIEPLSVTALGAPSPRDPRAVRIAAALLKNPADNRDLSAFGKSAGASARTLARLFVAETGMTFGEWRAQARVQAALVHLAAGESVANVAERVGYSSASAFIAAFRRQTGSSPSTYFA